MLDGVYVDDGQGGLRFHTAAAPADQEMDRLIETIERRLHRLLMRRGMVDQWVDGNGAVDEWLDREPVLAEIASGSVQGRRVLGERRGAAVVRCDATPRLRAPEPARLGPCHARCGFDLQAAVVVPPRDRARLERLCRYALRPPVAHDRLHLTAEHQ